MAHAGTAYLVRPGEDGEGTGPGVLVLHSAWGLTTGVKDFCDQLCDEGFVVLAPDLLGGARPASEAQAQEALVATDPNATAGLVLSSAAVLRSATDDPHGPVAVVGFSMGASWALWAATRQPETFSAVVAYYGTTDLAFDGLTARLMGHFATQDEVVDADALVKLESDLFELGHEPEFWHYEGAQHGFAEPLDGEGYHAESASLAWQRTLEFLRRGRADHHNGTDHHN